MTGNDAPPITGGGAAPGGPPWPVELLADLHAGVFDDDTAAELQARVDAVPEARATLAALDATRAALAALPPQRMPDDVAARIDAALRAEAAARLMPLAQPTVDAPRTSHPDQAHWTPRASPADTPRTPAGQAQAQQPPHAVPGHPRTPAGSAGGRPAAAAPVVDLAAARQRQRPRRRGLLAGAALLTAAAAAVGIVAVSGLTGGRTAGTPQAGPTTNASDQPLPPLAVSSNNLGAAVDDALSTKDYGPLAAAGRLDACLAANRLDPSTARPLGAREVSLDASLPGVLLILPTGTAGRLRLLVVSPDCGAGNPAVLADATVGR